MIADALLDAYDRLLKNRLSKPAQRDRVVSSIMTGFANLRKKPVDDMSDRINRVQASATLLAREVSVGFLNGRLVIKTAGSSQSFLSELRRGTNWYEPWDKVDEVIVAAIMTDPGK